MAIYLKGKDMVDLMLEFSKHKYQQDLAEELGISAASLSKYKNDRVSKKAFEKYLKKYPDVDRRNFYLKTPFYINKFKEDIHSNNFDELSQILENMSALQGILHYKSNIYSKKEEIIQNIFNYRYKHNRVAGALCRDYISKKIHIKDLSKVNFMPIGLCFNKLSKCNNICFECEHYITTRDFLPILIGMIQIADYLNSFAFIHTGEKDRRVLFTFYASAKNIIRALSK